MQKEIGRQGVPLYRLRAAIIRKLHLEAVKERKRIDVLECSGQSAV